MGTARSVRRLARPAITELHRRQGIRSLRHVDVDGIAARHLLTGLHRGLLRQPSPVESAYLARIEDRRRQLEAREDGFEFEEMGAGETRPAATIGERTRQSSKPAPWAYMLFCLVRELRALEAIEMGTCVGVSAGYQAAAQRLNAAGRLTTLEGSPALAAVATETLEGLGLGDTSAVVVGRFADTLDAVLAERHGRVDWLFIDGHHDGDATLGYLEQVLPHLAPEAVIAFDDIAWSAGMAAAWSTIRADDRFHLTVDSGSVGFAAVSRATGHHEITVPVG